MNESKRYKAMLQERADLVKEQQALFAAVDKDGRALTAEEKTRDDTIHTRLTDISADLEREERRREWERKVGTTAPAVLKLGRGDDATKALAHFFRSGDSGGVKSLMQADETGKPSVTISIPTLAEMQQARYQAAVVDSTMNITTAADGANIVPTGLVNRIAARRNEADLTNVLGLQNVPGVGTTVNFPVEGADPEVFAATSEQADAHTNNYERDAGAINLKAFTLAKKTRKIELTEEVLEDQDAALMAFIGDHIGRQIAKTHNAMLITEIAANGTALKTYASASTIAAGEPEAIVFNDALGYYLEDGGSVAWVTRPSTFGAVASLTGNPRLYAQTPAGSFQRQLLEYPVHYSQAVAAPAASAKSVYFGNWNQVGYREAPEVRFIMDPYSVDGLVILKYSFRAVFGVLQAAAVGYGVHPSA